MTKILVLNGNSYASPLVGLGDIVYTAEEFLNDPRSFGLVLFTGGEDITPSWYGHTSPKSLCYYNTARDKGEKIVFDLAKELGIPMMGICRGIQFLNVMNGGQMYHHVTNHATGSASRHGMTVKNGEQIDVNSLHHQMVIPPENATVLAWSTEHISGTYIGDEDEEVDAPAIEPEAVIYPDTKCVGVQYHPEMMPTHSRGFTWFRELAEKVMSGVDFNEIERAYTEDPCKAHQSGMHQQR